MVESLAYRTADQTRWGDGEGADLSAVVIDLNFWKLFTSLQALEDHQDSFAGIDFMVLNGDQLFVHLTDHRVLGPLTIPTSRWNPRGEWQPLTGYASFDIVTNNGRLYLVNVQHTSAGTFSPFATDGISHDLYSLLLEQPATRFPTGGTIHQRLVKSSESPFQFEWISDRIRLAPFVAGQPNPGEVVMQYAVVDDMTFPTGLIDSVVFQGTPSGSAVSWTLFKDGDAIGSIDFSGPSPETVTVTFPTDVDFIPGNVITLIAPATPDSAQANVSFTFVALLT
jgi:hypothetical protein